MMWWTVASEITDEKIGHAGTLDPLATGLLIMLSVKQPKYPSF